MPPPLRLASKEFLKGSLVEGNPSIEVPSSQMILACVKLTKTNRCVGVTHTCVYVHICVPLPTGFPMVESDLDSGNPLFMVTLRLDETESFLSYRHLSA